MTNPIAWVLGKARSLIDMLFDSQKRLTWRRLAVMAIATGLVLISDKLSGEYWTWIAMTYIGGDTAEKALKYLGNRG